MQSWAVQVLTTMHCMHLELLLLLRPADAALDNAPADAQSDSIADATATALQAVGNKLTDQTIKNCGIVD